MTSQEPNSPQGYKTPVGILGVGHFVPEEVVTNQDLARFVDTTDEWIVGRTGIRARRRARPDQATSDLAVEAARRALQAAGTQAEDLDLIIVATMTPDCPMPATASLVQHQLGANKAGGFDLNIACSGFVYALITGAQFVASGTFKRVLVVGADCMTRLMNWKDRTTCVLFGDGAGAVVLGPVRSGYGLVGVHAGVNGAGGPNLTVKAGGSRLPSWSEGVNAGDYYLQMEGPEVFRFAVSVMGEAAIKALENGGLSPEQVALFIPHQANARIIEASRKRLNLPHERVFSNVEHYGNTSCGSVPIALSEALEQGRVQEGDLVVLVGFGGGLSWASVALRWGGQAIEG
ncbi:MAG: beta-ketoacyl-ACP synthase III [Vulcanimicrobiota bacterium]